MQSNYHDVGSKVYSYQTCILERVENIVIGNITPYSNTTTTHQHKAGAFSADVRLSDVMEGAGDLLSVALARGILLLVAGAYAISEVEARHESNRRNVKMLYGDEPVYSNLLPIVRH